MSAKKVKVKVAKKRLKIKNILVSILILILTILVTIDIIKLPVKNIYISGNEILNDKTIIELAELNDYPPYINTFLNNIKNKLLENDYIKNVYIKRTLSRKIYIEIEEYKPICIYNDKLVLSSTKAVENTYNIDYVPHVINNIDDIYDKFINKFNKVDKEILLKISHIKYEPNKLDKERFLLYMTDNNYVYITLLSEKDSSIENLNKYNNIVQKLENQKGIVYLDEGNYFKKFEINNWHNHLHII